MNKNDIDCYRYIIDSSVSTIRNNDYIIIHNSMEVVQYIIYIYIINDDIKNTIDYY